VRHEPDARHVVDECPTDTRRFQNGAQGATGPLFVFSVPRFSIYQYQSKVTGTAPDPLGVSQDGGPMTKRSKKKPVPRPTYMPPLLDARLQVPTPKSKVAAKVVIAVVLARLFGPIDLRPFLPPIPALPSNVTTVITV
jgi:hypothetical protein